MSSDIVGNNQQRAPICHIENGIAWITLNRPEKANAVNSELLINTIAAIDYAERESDVHAIILSGQGRHFCAGADLVEFLQGGAAAFRRLLDLFREVCLRLEASPLPVIAMVQGAARAGGLEFMLCCDAVVASRSATIGDAHALRNLLPGGGNSVRLPRTIGHQRAKWMILSGASISATQARDWGIINRVVEHEDLRGAAHEMATELSVAHHSTIGLAKKLMTDSYALGFDDALENEIATLEKHANTEVLLKSLKKFVEH